MGRIFANDARLANAAQAVTPSDTESNATQLPATTVGLFIGTAGNVVAKMFEDSTSKTYKNLAAGSTLVGNFKYVLSTNTTAADIVALYLV